MNKKITIQLVLIFLIGFTFTGVAQNKLAPLKEYLGISYKKLKKKYRKTGFKLKKADDYYLDSQNKLLYYYDKNSKKVYAIVSEYSGLEYASGETIPRYIHNKLYYLTTYTVVVDNPENWVMMVDESVRLYRIINGFLLVDINLSPEDFRYNAVKVDSNEQLQKKRTNVGDFKDFEYSKFINSITKETISRCITQNCDKEGENITMAYFNIDKETQAEFKGLFKDGAAHGKAVLKWTTPKGVSVIIDATFSKGDMHGDFEMEIYDKNKVLNWSYKGKVVNGVLSKVSFKNYDFRVYGTWEQLTDTTVLINYDNNGYSYPGQFEIWGVKKTFDDGLNGTFLYDGTGYLFPFTLHSLPIYSYFGQFSTDYYLKKNTKSRVKGDEYAGFEWNYFWKDGTKSPASSLDLPFYRYENKKKE